MSAETGYPVSTGYLNYSHDNAPLIPATLWDPLLSPSQPRMESDDHIGSSKTLQQDDYILLKYALLWAPSYHRWFSQCTSIMYLHVNIVTYALLCYVHVCIRIRIRIFVYWGRKQHNWQRRSWYLLIESTGQNKIETINYYKIKITICQTKDAIRLP